MSLRKNKNKTPQEPVEQGPTPYEMGLTGTVNDFYKADRDAQEDAAEKKGAFVAYDKKSKGGMSMRWGALDKYFAFEKAYNAAKNVPCEIRQGFQSGAFQAFLEGRPDNLQEIMYNPELFRREYQSAYSLLTSTLINLVGGSSDPETALLALAKVDEDKARQGILDNTLYELVWGYNNIEGAASALLRAGAKADHESSRTLAAAFVKQPQSIIDMLQENGATFDKAVATMRANPKRYGDSADRIEFLQYKQDTDATIQQLKQTIAELTGKPTTPDALPDAPVKTTAPLKLKISSAGPQ